MTSTGALKQMMKTAAYVLALILLVSCSSHGQTQDQISLSPNAKFEIGCSPNGSALNIILKGIQQSEKSVLVAAYSFISKPISTALLEAHNRGVAVQVIADKKSNSGKYYRPRGLFHFAERDMTRYKADTNVSACIRNIRNCCPCCWPVYSRR